MPQQLHGCSAPTTDLAAIDRRGSIPHFHAQLVVIARNRQVAAGLLAQVANDRDIIATEAVTQPPLDPRVTGRFRSNSVKRF